MTHDARAGAMTDNSDPAPAPPASGAQDVAVHLSQHFHGSVFADGAHFGTALGPGHRQALTGRLDTADIRTALSRFVRPAGYVEALSALVRERVVVLRGERGTGKQTGAIALLREVTDGPLHVLAPTTALADLATYEFRAGAGYLVAEHTLGAGTGLDLEFEWRTVRDRVRERGAWLITTSTETAAGRVDTVSAVDWQRPDQRAFVAVWLADAAAGAEPVVSDVDAVVEALPPECTLTDLSAIMTRICGGQPIDAAVQVRDHVVRDEVRRWFDEGGPRTRTQILEVTVSAFLGGCDRRYFELRLAELTDAVAAAIPLPPRAPVPFDRSDGFLPQQWLTGSGADGLVTVRRADGGTIPGQRVEFRVPAFRALVIGALRERMGVAFWDAVAGWLGRVVATTEPRDTDRHLAIAAGVAEFAAIDVAEAYVGLLEPWSDGAAGWSGQLAAVQVLWSMCRTESFAPVALRYATLWATHGSTTQRTTAAHAFSGPLGVRYPDEAVGRLWQLARQNEHDDTAAAALASLFASLSATESRTADLVLDRLLSEHVVARTLRARACAARAAASVLSVRDHHTGRPAALSGVHGDAGRIDTLAQVWVAALGFGPVRRQALDALLDGLGDLAARDDAAVEVVAALGSGLARASSARELRSFLHDLDVISRRRNAANRTVGAHSAESPAEIARLTDVLTTAARGTRIDRKQ
ncbi:hypothetical protein [Nocardia farcinica]|uniref:hypothetical protein n=1 Tax=Nocardia farcinica TaxID=37329 RepID=UPI001894F1AE|nr:hypothetical protein [Nocardia farcinica]MBF6442557.1 hypothetical protein [Nocardia farcinica]MBF6522940.1 hypothetical protein [Nocardia farcinica]